ncbi:BT_3987 domain-containing protein [Labilibaculum sp.]|uniref:BT_3987 domain-containing protein n=1 Tax=Labilibaculum sp. TaxID=2060723 RepID=UPI003564F5F5
MKQITVFLSGILLLATLFSCEEYEDYTYDYDYTTVYFGSQTPIRTVVARDTMELELGVTIGGVLENNSDEWATYSVDEDLLAIYDTEGLFTVLPEEYYSLSNDSIFVIEKGEYAGTVTCTFDRDLFTADAFAMDETYAIPLLLNNTSVDSILSTKDYSIIVVKYVSPYHGYYYSKGVQYTLGEDGFPTDTTTFYDADLSQNDVKEFSTLGLNTISATYFGSSITGDMELTVNDDNTVDVTSDDVTITNDDNCIYDEDEKTFYLNVELTKSSISYSVSDTLILRQDPEDDIRYEEW